MLPNPVIMRNQTLTDEEFDKIVKEEIDNNNRIVIITRNE
jgi:hypothetical protein